MVPRRKSCKAQISFVIHIKIEQYPSLRSMPRVTSKSHESKNKQILQPLSKSYPSIFMTYSCMVPRQKSCKAKISFVIHIKIDQYHSLRSVPCATSPSHESKNKQILQPLSKIYPSIYMTELHATKTEKFYSSNIICDTHQN